MPGVFTHDVVSVTLAPFAAAANYFATGEFTVAIAGGVAFLFAGVMFGPDLDVASRQYARWGPLRVIWLPYRTTFPHRSRWSHGLVFGTLIRVIYLFGAITLLYFAGHFIYASLWGKEAVEIAKVFRSWGILGDLVGDGIARDLVIAAFVGLWAGAASHTLTDITVSYIKTGKTGEFL
jgi:uncharacterized metal-binding protein